MALTHRRSRDSFIADEGPDLTPMIDCVFLLLIFFMVTTVFIHARGLDVDLPALSEPMEQQEERKDINIQVGAQGRVELAGLEVPPAGLAAAIAQAMREANNHNVIVQAHPDCPQKHVIRVVDAAREAGVQGLAFAREETGGGT